MRPQVEVEDAIYTHPAIMDVAIVGIPDDLLGELVGAAVQVKPEYRGKVGLEDIAGHLRTKIAAFKIPIYVKFVDEPLPRNANGKSGLLYRRWIGWDLMHSVSVLKKDLRDVVASEYRKIVPKAKL